jgi:hypothetical protein
VEVDAGVEQLQVPQEQVAGDGLLGCPEAAHGMVRHRVACRGGHTASCVSEGCRC